jgi:hypothetical protein
MTDSNEEPQGEAVEREGLAVIPFSELADKFGVTPLEDPESGRVFFLWDHMFSRNEEGIPLPHYTVQETAKVFFGRGPDWLRWRYRPATHYPQGYFVLGNTVLEPKRTEKGNRYYTLADIERMAHALVQNNAMDGEQLLIVLQLVLLQAQVHRVIDIVPA